MKAKKHFRTLEEARKLLGDDFWEVMSDVLPFVGPRVDVYRGDREVLVAAELPGLSSEQDVSVTLHGYTLVIEGQIVRDYAIDESRFLLDERAEGSFKRKIRLPKDCQLDAIRADYWNGLLLVRIPLAADGDSGPGEKVHIHFHR
ncbi:Hsp20/alpha crystallin family protein [Geobacillus zalihae]|uniref:Hsp20/alpha crystallin family protein n=1 Tax=Geobacillus zalihae TaxID=213419 RepID=UPI002619577E|nr:Hsp20/alpha crystallin family protein [Geobacillus zalihae]WKA48420.1 Hsp20/alpha crystallin family protein [Geobacillus zalihae]